jgi:hypothetical protein
MTIRQSLVAKLLVSLEDEQSIESSSLEEIEANLRALGSDPATSIAFAERLAAAARSPVARRRTQSDGSVTPEEVDPGEGPAVAKKLKSRARASGVVGLGASRTGPSWRRKMAVAACRAQPPVQKLDDTDRVR